MAVIIQRLGLASTEVEEKKNSINLQGLWLKS